jgi:hypothetical protein
MSFSPMFFYHLVENWKLHHISEIQSGPTRFMEMAIDALLKMEHCKIVNHDFFHLYWTTEIQRWIVYNTLNRSFCSSCTIFCYIIPKETSTSWSTTLIDIIRKYGFVDTSAPSWHSGQNFSSNFFAAILVWIDAVFHGLSETRVNFVGSYHFDTHSVEILKKKPLAERIDFLVPRF